VVIPRKGKPSAARRQVEHSRAFRRLVKWRTGSEGRISILKHGYGWDRTLFDGIGGARTRCGPLSPPNPETRQMVLAPQCSVCQHLRANG